MSNKLTRNIHPEIRVINEQKGIVDYVASDETLDCYREVIRASGWRFDLFTKNAPFVDSHDYTTIKNQIGSVIDFKVVGKKLIERVCYAIDVAENELARLAFNMVKSGHLKAVSVGFFPVQAVSKWDNDPKGFSDALGDVGMTPEDGANLRTIFLVQQQIELSQCIIGANPNALAKAHIDGVVTDEQLHRLGFGDDDMQFLHEAAASYDLATPPQRTLLRQEMRHITRTRPPHAPLSAKPTEPKTASLATDRADADEARRREEERKFLRKFKNIIKTN